MHPLCGSTEAVRLHGGEAAGRDRFKVLFDRDRAALLDYLESL